MFKKVLIGATLILTSSLAHASLIEYNGYSRDTSSNIVTGGGLEWLMWDVTRYYSINQALAAYQADGWTLASNVQMASLFNVFQFGKTDWSDNNVPQTKTLPWTADEDSEHNQFILLFGSTQSSGSPNYLESDPYFFTSAAYGNDENNDGLYNLASVNDDFTRVLTNGQLQQNQHMARFTSINSVNSTGVSSSRGVALVREVNDSTPIQVPLPGSLSLLALGMVALGVRRRQALRR